MPYGHAWTEIELEILKLYPVLSKEDLLAKLPRRTWVSIKSKARVRLGLRKIIWTALENLPRLPLEDWQAAWLACAIDGEGSISLQIAKHQTSRGQTSRGWNYVPRIDLYNNNVQFLLFARQLMPYNKRPIRATAILRPQRQHKNYTIATRAMPVIYAVLKRIKPFLIIKSRHADLILEFLEIQNDILCQKGLRAFAEYSERQNQIYKELRVLNDRRLP